MKLINVINLSPNNGDIHLQSRINKSDQSSYPSLEMVDELKAEVSGPVDKFRLVYIIFYWLGIGTLLPWNMFITVGRLDRLQFSEPAIVK